MNCSHNKSGACFSNRVNIGGNGATESSTTCCGSFLDEKLYGSLTNNVENNGGPCDCLVCSVETCSHNENCLCNLSSIDVSGFNSRIYEETSCDSFES
jgi:hypothetical protein